MYRRTPAAQKHLTDFLTQPQAAETKAKLQEQKARLAVSEDQEPPPDQDVPPSEREDFVPAPPGHQMTEDELKAEYDAIQAEQAAEAGEDPTDEFGEPADMPPMNRKDPYVPKPPRLSHEEIEALKPKPQTRKAARTVSVEKAPEESPKQATQIVKHHFKPDAPIQNFKNLKSLAEGMRESIAGMLPQHITPERMFKALYVAFSKTPKLFKCDEKSIGKALMEASELGLDCSGTLGAAYLIPYGTECKLIPGYRGLIDLARRSNEIDYIEVHPVYAQDKFTVKFGTNPMVEHEPYLGADRKEEFIAFYGVAGLKGGSKQIEMMTVSDVKRIQGMSKMGNAPDGPWKQHFSEMGRKTVVRRLCKYLPMSAELEKALELDDKSGEFDFGSVVDIQVEDVENRTEQLTDQLTKHLGRNSQGE